MQPAAPSSQNPQVPSNPKTPSSLSTWVVDLALYIIDNLKALCYGYDAVLHHACAKGHLYTVEKWIELSEVPHLLTAARTSQVAIVKLLIQREGNPSLLEPALLELLRRKIETNQSYEEERDLEKTLLMLLESSEKPIDDIQLQVDPESPERLPLLSACFRLLGNSYPDEVAFHCEFFWGKKLNSNQLDTLGRTPLMHTCSMGRMDLIGSALTSLSASLSSLTIQDNNGKTALIHFCESETELTEKLSLPDPDDIFIPKNFCISFLALTKHTIATQDNIGKTAAYYAMKNPNRAPLFFQSVYLFDQATREKFLLEALTLEDPPLLIRSMIELISRSCGTCATHLSSPAQKAIDDLKIKRPELSASIEEAVAESLTNLAKAKALKQTFLSTLSFQLGREIERRSYLHDRKRSFHQRLLSELPAEIERRSQRKK